MTGEVKMPPSSSSFTWICFWVYQVTLIQLTSSASVHYSCKNPMDIRDIHGVRMDKIPGSRIEYDPFPNGFRIIPGRTLQMEFRTDSGSGLIFVAGDFDLADMATAYLRRGHVVFARRCGNGRAFEVYRERVDDRKWHKLTYEHNERGGRLFVDDQNPFRQYHLGPCVHFRSVVFGGLSPLMAAAPLKAVGNILEPVEEYHESELLARHRFYGCMRNLRIDAKIPVIQPKYYAVSQCDDP